MSGDELAVFKPKKIESIDPDAISGLRPAALDDLSKRQVRALTNDQLAGLSKKQIKKADDFIDLLSNQQLDQLSFDPGSFNRQEHLVETLNQQVELFLPILINDA